MNELKTYIVQQGLDILVKLFEIIYEVDGFEITTYLTVGLNKNEVEERETEKLKKMEKTGEIVCLLSVTVEEVVEVDGYKVKLENA